jgi:pimeloyl-ACP methyl ester carboxylesterase
MEWVRGYYYRGEGVAPSTYVAKYRLTELMAKGLIDREQGQEVLDTGGLEDFVWEVTWPEDFETPDEYLVDRVANVQGYAVFVHGWTGNHTIWEEIPAMTVLANRRLVAFSVDHNGFGLTTFKNKTPALEDCNPPAAMRTIQRWIDLIKIRRQPGNPNLKVVNLIGHSMGGATLFYKNPMQWSYSEVTRYALAPALLLEDDIHRRFYTTLGIGIGILQRVPALEFVERFVKPNVVETLAAGASHFVKEAHSKQYEETARGVTGATFVAMGRLSDYEIAREWDLFRVMLGHRDPLVGLTPMMDLLSKMEFPTGNMRVVPGSHYMFSISNDDPQVAYQHAQNRELVVQDILELHERAYTMQRAGKRIG